jgi:hypothetical protein
MERSLFRVITFVAIAQFVPLVLFPWDLSVRSLVFISLLALLCAFLGWALLRRKAWGRTLTIFVQGFNIIVRIITFFGNVYKPGRGLNVGLMIAYIASIALSVVLLNYIDRPEIQLAYES